MCLTFYSGIRFESAEVRVYNFCLKFIIHRKLCMCLLESFRKCLKNVIKQHRIHCLTSYVKQRNFGNLVGTHLVVTRYKTLGVIFGWTSFGIHSQREWSSCFEISKCDNYFNTAVRACASELIMWAKRSVHIVNRQLKQQELVM